MSIDPNRFYRVTLYAPFEFAEGMIVIPDINPPVGEWRRHTVVYVPPDNTVRFNKGESLPLPEAILEPINYDYPDEVPNDGEQ